MTIEQQLPEKPKANQTPQGTGTKPQLRWGLVGPCGGLILPAANDSPSANRSSLAASSPDSPTSVVDIARQASQLSIVRGALGQEPTSISADPKSSDLPTCRRVVETRTREASGIYISKPEGRKTLAMVTIPRGMV